MTRKFYIWICVFFSVIVSAQTIKIPLRKYRVAFLSDSLKETSGLCFLNQKLHTFNDGGNPNELYHIDKKSGRIIQKLPTPFPNIDWEAITTDSTHIYLGDFGNNSGKRHDLCIYKFPFSQNTKEENFLKINFEYQFPKNYEPPSLKHDFDAEALIYHHQKLHLFTKEWKNKATSRYLINPNASEKQILQKLESYQTNFLVTDAALYNKKLYLIGYNKRGNCFLFIFDENSDGLFFSNPPKKFKLGSVLTIGQIEGIAINSEGLYLSSENISKFIFNRKPSLYFVPFSALKEN